MANQEKTTELLDWCKARFEGFKFPINYTVQVEQKDGGVMLSVRPFDFPGSVAILGVRINGNKYKILKSSRQAEIASTLQQTKDRITDLMKEMNEERVREALVRVRGGR